MLIVENGDPHAPDVTALLTASHALMLELFPPEDNYALEIEALTAPDIHFYVAREGTQVMGTGALAVKDGYGEVKSMFTSPGARGKGVAAALLRQLEDQARDLGLSALKLETGEALDAAVRLYERHGFARCGRFGDYAPNATSVFMEKPLEP
ncbi:GNAT family N-acetyltransferase [Roseovarius sp. 2305UL8-3]|uniref:GNAT family N-acetyltransferase n=1 Tax=Roseovarius conchicola TaxID=3121636 RepID=UPI0035270CDB